MTSNIEPPAPPAPDAKIDVASPSAEMLARLTTRRSTPVKLMTDPGPSPSDVDAILQIAARAPDHRRLEPWRFIVLEGDARAAFGEALAQIWRASHPEATETELEMERARPLRAPVCVVVVSSTDPSHKTPVWEQELSAGAVCMNLLHAADAMGWAAAWITEWCAYDEEAAAALGLDEHEQIAGFIYLGSAPGPVPERPRPTIADKITRWTA